MKKFNVLCFLLVLLSLNCTTDSVKLVNLCEPDHFEVNGLRVNSVHFVERSVRLESAYFYLALYEKCHLYAMDSPDDNSTAASTRELDEIKRD